MDKIVSFICNKVAQSGFIWINMYNYGEICSGELLFIQ
jgi:hypothetical protein